MNSEIVDFMNINVKSENIELSNLISDIIPIREARFTNLEIEINESQEFRLVVYKKENILSRIISFISIGLEKIKIMRNSKTNAMKKAYNK